MSMCSEIRRSAPRALAVSALAASSGGTSPGPSRPRVRYAVTPVAVSRPSTRARGRAPGRPRPARPARPAGPVDPGMPVPLHTERADVAGSAPPWPGSSTTTLPAIRGPLRRIASASRSAEGVPPATVRVSRARALKVPDRSAVGEDPDIALELAQRRLRLPAEDPVGPVRVEAEAEQRCWRASTSSR